MISPFGTLTCLLKTLDDFSVVKIQLVLLWMLLEYAKCVLGTCFLKIWLRNQNVRLAPSEKKISSVVVPNAKAVAHVSLGVYGSLPKFMA